MTDRKIRVLLIDGQVEDSRWVQELLVEFEEGRFGGGWMHGIEVFHLERLADALTVLGDSDAPGQFDVVLLNPALPDSSGLHSYLRVRNHSPEIPVVILSELDDPDLAISMVRAGAQDFLAKTELDSLPLARSLRVAVERNLILRDLRALAWRDESTGLSNRNGFDIMAGRDVTTARCLGTTLAVILLDLEGLVQLAFSYGREEQQLALTESSDLIRQVFEPAATLARIGANTFAACLVAHSEPEVKRALALLEMRFHHMQQKANRSSIQLRCGVAWLEGQLTVAELLESAQASLCENLLVEKETGPRRSTAHA